MWCAVCIVGITQMPLSSLVRAGTIYLAIMSGLLLALFMVGINVVTMKIPAHSFMILGLLFMGSYYTLFMLNITAQKFVFFSEETENMICVYEKSGGANVRDSFVGLIRERIFGSYFLIGTEYKLHRFDDQGYAVSYFG